MFHLYLDGYISREHLLYAKYTISTRQYLNVTLPLRHASMHFGHTLFGEQIKRALGSRKYTTSLKFPSVHICTSSSTLIMKHAFKFVGVDHGSGVEG